MEGWRLQYRQATLGEIERAMLATQPDAPDLPTHLAYLTKRTAQMQYLTFQQAGWPLGSGPEGAPVESANKLPTYAKS